MSTDSETSPYELLGVSLESTDAEIRKAYRQRSLKVHPDRNPNNKDAAKQFHELTQAYELLLDPLRRMALDAAQRLKEARKARFSGYDNKRKNLQAELEAREQEFKKRKVDKAKQETERFHEAERIKEEGRLMREQKEKDMLRREEEVEKAGVNTIDEDDEDAPPKLGSLDTTVKLKYPLASHPNLTTSASLSSLLTQFGAVDDSSIVLSIKPPKKAPNKPPKYATALVPFKQIGDAFAAVCASGRPDRGLDGIDIIWAEGNEPPILAWLKAQGKLSSASVRPKSPPLGVSSLPRATPGEEPTTSFSSFPDSFPSSFDSSPPKATTPAVAGFDYESLTLMRLRQAERDRLEREIREQEANES
ncbi:DnaJ-domain-containing protein [Rickenella mellea]|uniref:DnaJ-domain-containing protein n=1 Tax=Rickenella mellea TaxID=50990 RepID=A0A4Y7PV70_9AGAM|nr:DnaJ-domain-containing protein [Rickenella mellea]